MVTTSPLGRPLDFRYRSNIVVVIAAVVVGAAFGIYEFVAGDPLASSWWQAGGAVFVAWAIARELDPDRDLSGYAAMAFAALAAAVAAPSLLLGFGFLVGARLMAGTVGIGLGRVDPLAVIAISALLGTDAIAVTSVPVIIVGVFLLAGRTRLTYLLAAASLTAAGIALALFATYPGWEGLEGWGFAFLGAIVFADAVSVYVGSVRSVTDIGAKPLQSWRVSAARLAAVMTVGLAFAATGQNGVLAAGATIIAAATGVLAGRLQPRN